jgi:hypothetical protein
MRDIRPIRLIRATCANLELMMISARYLLCNINPTTTSLPNNIGFIACSGKLKTGAFFFDFLECDKSRA